MGGMVGDSLSPDPTLARFPVASSHLHPGSNPRESAQESHPKQGCIAGSSGRGDRIGAGGRGAEQIVRCFLLFPGGCVLAFRFFERFGDAGFLLVLFLQICGRVRGSESESDQERGAPVLGENRRNAGGFGWLVLFFLKDSGWFFGGMFLLRTQSLCSVACRGLFWSRSLGRCDWLE